MNQTKYEIKNTKEVIRTIDNSKRFPDFFVVGAARSGTTSLWMYLLQHPKIFMPREIELKEPSFFCDLLDLYDVDAYLRLFSDAKPESAIGEASTAYLTSPESADLICNANPDARIIIMIRNPIDRALSLYKWMIREGYEWITPFEKALEVENKKRLNKLKFKFDNPQYYYNYLYFNSGCYSNQIRRYQNRFPKKQIYYIVFNEFINNPLSVVKNVYEFLGVSRNFTPVIKIHNKSTLPYSVKAQYLIRRKIFAIPLKFDLLKAKKIMDFALKLNLKMGENREVLINDHTRKNLLKRFSDDIKITSKLININLEEWLN